jgi:hypothetical protein
MKPAVFHPSTVQYKFSITQNCSDISTDQVSEFTTHPMDLEVVRNLITASNTSPAVLEVFKSSILLLKQGLVNFSLVLLLCSLLPESLRHELITSLQFWCCY